MADYSLSIDLMQYIGAQIVNLKIRPRKEGESDEEYAKVPVLQYAAIPTAHNDIKVQPDNAEPPYRTYSGQHAYISVTDRQMDANNKLIQSDRRRLLQAGEQETAYNVHCREVRPRYRREWETAARARYCAQIKAQHPEWANLEDQGRGLARGTERNPLTAAINAKFPYSVGNGFLVEYKSNQTAPAAPVAQQVSGYTAPTYSEPTYSADNSDESDLPF